MSTGTALINIRSNQEIQNVDIAIEKFRRDDEKIDDTGV